jgi:beta-glucosidase
LLQHGDVSQITPFQSPFSSAVQAVRDGANHHEVASSLVAQMTVEEKLGCLDGDIPFWPGLFDMSSGGYYRHPWPAAVVERLGIPGLMFSDGPRGCVIGAATAFPVSMARGATFDVELEQAIGEAIGAELQASGATYTGAVCMNLLRHPAWGRAQETYGEDPQHVGDMARALTIGLQRHVMACMKHFALNSMENARFTVDVTADERALHEVYLPHFRKVADAGVASVMSAYNSLNGEWCGENGVLLTGILRDEWGWDGFVTSDFVFGLRDAVKSVKAGLDIEMPFSQQRVQHLAQALDSGKLSLGEIELCTTRIVATFLRFASVFETKPDVSVIASSAHRALARQACVQSIVLLQNEGEFLPKPPATVKQIAVIGRLADVSNLGDGGSSDVHPPSVSTPLDGIRAYYPDAIVEHSTDDPSVAKVADLVVVVVGYTKADEGEYIDQSGTAQVAAEFNIFPPMDHPVVGAQVPAVMAPDAPTCRPKHEEAANEDRSMAPGGDRSTLRLSDADEALIAGVRAHNANVVVCVMAGSAVVMPWAASVPAVLMLWYPGMEGGRALGSVLTGESEPGGRLPFAVPRNETDLVAFDKNARTVVYGLFHGQWKLDRDGVVPHFAFGHGLGYTKWEKVSEDTQTDRAVVEIRNVGSRPGATIVLLFASMPGSQYDRPHRRLLGFTRVAAGPGETVSAQIIPENDLLRVRIDGTWVTENKPIQYEVVLTGS